MASTKAYTAQLAAMALFALKVAAAHGADPDLIAGRASDLAGLPALLSEVLSRSGSAALAAPLFEGAHSALFLGRGLNSATAAEGALKLKEVSYLHAESYPAGEMKHGPIALLEPGFPVVVVVPNDAVRAKTVSSTWPKSLRPRCERGRRRYRGRRRGGRSGRRRDVAAGVPVVACARARGGLSAAPCPRGGRGARL